METVDLRPLRIWVWTDVLHGHTAGMAVVIAHDEAEAAEAMRRDMPQYIWEQLPFAAARSVGEPAAFYVYGADDIERLRRAIAEVSSDNCTCMDCRNKLVGALRETG